MGLTDTLGGVETYIYNLVKNTDRDKIHFDFLCQGREEAAYQRKISEYYSRNVHFYFIPTFKKDILNCIRLLKTILSMKYDILYINACIATDVLYAIPYARKYNTKVVVHSHGSSIDRKKLQHTLFKSVVSKYADVRLACSINAARFFWNDIDTVLLIKNGIEIDRFRYSEDARERVRRQYGVKDSQILLGHVGRLSYLKNQEYLLGIVKNLLDLGIDTKLLLVGDGEDRPALENRIDRYCLRECVVLCGEQKNISDYYSAFDVFVMPSISEGFPLVGVEAQTEGLLCVFSDTIDNQIILTDKSVSLHLGNDNQREWAVKIIDLISSCENRDRTKYPIIMKQQGFDIKDTANHIQELFSRLVE